MATWIHEEEPVLSYAALVNDAEGRVRRVGLKMGAPHDPEELRDEVLKAMAVSDFGEAGRPAVVRVSESVAADALVVGLEAVGVRVEVGATLQVQEAFDALFTQLRGGDEERFFTAYDKAELRAYLKTARTFFQIRPWDRIDGDRYIGFQIDDGPWAYLNVLGQMGEEFGLSYFDDWLQVCRMVHNQPTLFEALMEMESGTSLALKAAGAMEGMTLEPLYHLHPEDAVYLQELGLKPLRGGQYPVVRRFTAEGQTPHRMPLFVYQVLMEALIEVLSKRRAPRVTSIKKTVGVSDGTQVTLRYPARGDEELEGRITGVRLVIEGAEQDGYYNRLPPDTRLEVDVAGHVLLSKVKSVIKKQTPDDGLWVTGFMQGEACLWNDQMRTPSPVAAHLVGLQDLYLESLSRLYPMQAFPLMGPAPEEIQVRFL